MRKGLAVIALLAGAAAIGLYFSQRPAKPHSQSNQTQVTSNAAAPAVTAASSGPPVTTNPVASASSPGPTVAPATNEPGTAASLPPPPSTPPGIELGDLDYRVSGPPNMSVQTVLENTRTAIRDYGSMFGGNPVGTNPEITAALNGNNPKQARFLQAESGLRINSSGELVDPWGTPLFFHQISGTQTEIRSAGPDRKMWTADDQVVK